jgi:putative transposase
LRQVGHQALNRRTRSTEQLSATTTAYKEHWQPIRHTNLLERTFGEIRRPTKVIGRLPG